MQRVLILMALGLLLAGAVVLATGLDATLARAVVEAQRTYQNALGASLRALRAGQPGAVSGFLGLCFAYGFLHAVGPGHGKAVLGGYALTSGASLRAMAGLAALTSMAQAAVAVVLVYGAVWALGASRERVEGIAGLIEPLALLALAALGVMLLWRGAKGLIPAPGDHHHHHDEECGCAHLPDMAALSRRRTLREGAVLIAAVALRPCSGALVMLVLTWRLGLDALGVLGAFVMGLGTLTVTLVAAMAGGGMRRALGNAGRLVPWLEVLIGAALAVTAALTALRLL